MEEKQVILKLYQNVDMGIVGIESIEEKIQSRSLAKICLKQKEEYENIKKELLKFCKSYNVEDKELSPMAKISSEMMSNMKLMIDKTDSHIAKMMMEGTNKGLISLEEIKNNYHGKEKKLIDMIEKIIKIEQQNNEDLKIFL
ncbi:TPA: hypothetical protein IAB95_01125 [Candidatus Ventrenecus avicola]|nr:hypothetical protein [Candidatus Ventrenecus avicola]